MRFLPFLLSFLALGCIQTMDEETEDLPFDIVNQVAIKSLVIDYYPGTCAYPYSDNFGDLAGYNITYHERQYLKDEDYLIVFNSSDNDFGIPVCSIGKSSNYRYCLDLDMGHEDYQNLASSHRLVFRFHGDDWSISQMHPPDISLTNESGMVTGGYLKLAKEKSHAVLYYGEHLEDEGISFRLVDVEAHGHELSAVFNAIDQEGEQLHKWKTSSGNTTELLINESNYLFHVYRLTCGYSFGGSSKWADVALLSDEVVLEDGREIDLGEKKCKVDLFWTNKGISENDTRPDHLKAIYLNC